ncbi:MAG: OsmC family protein [Sphaerochaetaceae bacterium]
MSSELSEIKVNFLGRRQISVDYRGNTILTDQPVSAGGDGQAPTGFDLYVVSLAACAGFYVQLFCLKRQIPLDSVSMSMVPVFDPETDLLSNFNLVVKTNDQFPEKYKKTIHNLIDQCSVKKSLENPPKVNIELADM